MRLFLNWIFQLYEILKQIIIVLEGITVINFVYNNFIKQQKSEDNEQLTIDLYNEQHFENIINDLTYKLENKKIIIDELNSKLKNEDIKNFSLKSDLDKEKKTTKELETTLTNLKAKLDKEREYNNSLILLKEREHINELSSKLKNEDIKNFKLISDLEKERETTKELETTLTNVKSDLDKERSTNKELETTLANVKSDLDKEKKTNNKERKMNDELRKDFLKIIEVNNDLQTKLKLTLNKNNFCF